MSWRDRYPIYVLPTVEERIQALRGAKIDDRTRAELDSLIGQPFTAVLTGYSLSQYALEFRIEPVTGHAPKKQQEHNSMKKFCRVFGSHKSNAPQEAPLESVGPSSGFANYNDAVQFARVRAKEHTGLRYYVMECRAVVEHTDVQVTELT